MGRKNRRKKEQIRKIHKNKYIAMVERVPDKAGNGRSAAEDYTAVAEDIESKAKASQTEVPDQPKAEISTFKLIKTATSNTHGYIERPRKPFPRRSDIWFADLGNHYGTSVQSGIRPVFVISNNMSNRYSGTLTVLPMTTKLKRPEYPTHIELRSDYCVPDEYTTYRHTLEDSMVLAEQVTTIAKSSLKDRLGAVIDSEKLKEIDEAVKVQMEMV